MSYSCTQNVTVIPKMFTLERNLTLWHLTFWLLIKIYTFMKLFKNTDKVFFLVFFIFSYTNAHLKPISSTNLTLWHITFWHCTEFATNIYSNSFKSRCDYFSCLLLFSSYILIWLHIVFKIWKLFIYENLTLWHCQ